MIPLKRTSLAIPILALPLLVLGLSAPDAAAQSRKANARSGAPASVTQLAESTNPMDRLSTVNYATRVHSRVLSAKGPVTFYADRGSCEASAPSLVTEDFDAAVLPAAPNNIEGVDSPVSSFSSNGVYSPGDIEAGLVILSNGPTTAVGGDVVAVGAAFNGLPTSSTSIGSNFFADNTRLDFRPGASTVCFDFVNFIGDGSALDIEVYDTDGNLLAMESRLTGTGLAFGGVSSTTDIGHIVFNETGDGTFVDNVSFELTGPAPADPPVLPELYVETASGTTAGGPTYTRSASDFFTGACVASTNTVAYDTYSFTPGESGLHIINAVYPEHDGYLAVYEAPFNPAGDPCVGLVAQNDDGSGLGDSQAFAVLTAGTEYIIVVSGYGVDDSGPYDLEIIGGAEGSGSGGNPVEVAEDGDAPDALTGLQDATGAIDQITGTIDPGDTVDCYGITITDIDAFGATTSNSPPNAGGFLLDSQLQVFDGDLNAVVFNDDTVGGSGDFLSTIPAGSLTGLGYEPGDYVICITEWDVNAVNAAGEDIFGGNGRELRYPVAPSGDYLLANWVEGNAVNGDRPYLIEMTGLGEIAPPTIADARAAGPGEMVSFSGVVTRARGAFAYVQDETAGITIRQTSGDFFDDVADGTIAPGTMISVSGTTSEFRGLFQINGDDLASYSVDGTTDVPMPQMITLADLAANGESYEGELVQVMDLSTEATGMFAASSNVDVTDASGAGVVRVPNADDTEIDGMDIPVREFTFTGVVGQFTFSDPATDGYQLLAIDEGDIEEEPETGGTVEEDGDAADALSGTQDATGFVGQINGLIDSGDTADCYAISITDIDAFSATTENSPPNGAGETLDTQLQLFTSGLEGVVFNDDTVGATGLFSTLPAGALSGRGYEPGDYVLCVTEWDVDARNAADEDIFANEFRELIYADAPNGDNVLASWFEFNAVNGGRPYAIDLTGTGGDAGSACEDLTIALSPVTDYMVSSDGGFVRMVMEIVNESDEDCSFEAWGFSSDPLLTNGVFIRPGRAVTVPANSTLRQGYNQRVPADVQDGDYMYSVNIGQYDDLDPMASEIYSAADVVITKGNPTLGYNEFAYGYLKQTFGHDAQAFKAAYDAALPFTPRLETKDWGNVQRGTPQIRPNGPVMTEIPTEVYAELAGTTVGPNPFRSATTFEFDVTQEAQVSLTVYDVLGRLVATPVDSRLGTGRHSAVFNGRDLQAGTYVYRLQIGETVETGRVTLAR